jgi:6-phosphogluconolactonase
MGESIKPEVNVFPSLEQASRFLAEKIVEEANEAVEKRGQFTLALSGGKTPRLLYGLLAGEFSTKIDWTAVHFFWGDERCVPLDHPDSNFALAYDTLVSKIPIPPQNIHRITAEIEIPEKAAESYEKTLREFFKDSEEQASPTFDVILLGVGEDGHTASLFPGSLELKKRNHWVAAVNAPSFLLPQNRITLTFPLINRSRAVFFLVSGAEKSRVLKSILEEPDKARKLYPAAMVQARTKLIWYVDEDAFPDISSKYVKIVKL